jgi:hypothetical protein
MPLIDLKSDLTNLRFGTADIPGDRPGGGWSKEPFIVSTEGGLKRYIDNFAATFNSEDFLLRGGSLAPVRAAEDASRIFQLFSKTSRGRLFVAKQEVLSRIGTSLDGGYNLAVRSLFVNPLNEGVYSPLNTLLQVAGNAFGTHFYKQGLNPFTGAPKYMTLVKPLDNEFAGIKNRNVNRLVNLYKGKIQSKSGSNDTTLFSYKGGPGSILGIGATDIKAASDRTFGQFGDFDLGIRTNQYLPPLGLSKQSELVPLYKNRLGTSNGVVLYTYDGGEGVGKVPIKVVSQTQTSGTKNPLYDGFKFTTYSQRQIENKEAIGAGGSTLVDDFRKDLNSNPTNISTSPNYKTKNIEQRVNLGNPGQRGANRSNYTKGRLYSAKQNNALDGLNAQYLYKSEGVKSNKELPINDLVKFRIAVIDNDNPKEKIFTHFRAFINSFSDNMSAQWDNFRYTGRGENFYTYQGFDASYAMSFTVVAQSKQELSVMYHKLNYIKSTLSPDYSGQGYMRGNIAQLTMGGYLYEMPGIITSFDITIPNDTTWEIGINADGSYDSTVKELPHRVDVSMNFKPIYKFLPQRVKDINVATEQRFISLEDDGDKNNLYEYFANPNLEREPREEELINLPPKGIDSLTSTPTPQLAPVFPPDATNDDGSRLRRLFRRN